LGDTVVEWRGDAKASAHNPMAAPMAGAGEPAMPILTLTCVGDVPEGAAQRLSDRLGTYWRTEPGRVWVRLLRLAPEDYAENDVLPLPGKWPVFVQVLHREPPTGDALAAEACALTLVVAEVLARPAERVHVSYDPAARGRQWFGGVAVR